MSNLQATYYYAVHVTLGDDSGYFTRWRYTQDSDRHAGKVTLEENLTPDAIWHSREDAEKHIKDQGFIKLGCTYKFVEIAAVPTSITDNTTSKFKHNFIVQSDTYGPYVTSRMGLYRPHTQAPTQIFSGDKVYIHATAPRCITWKLQSIKAETHEALQAAIKAHVETAGIFDISSSCLITRADCSQERWHLVGDLMIAKAPAMDDYIQGTNCNGVRYYYLHKDKKKQFMTRKKRPTTDFPPK